VGPDHGCSWSEGEAVGFVGGERGECGILLASGFADGALICSADLLVDIAAWDRFRDSEPS
jgi:hypothetical protein